MGLGNRTYPKGKIQERDKGIQKEMDDILSSYQGKGEELISILQRVQERFSYIPEEAMERIAQFIGIPQSSVFGVVSFYAQFKLRPAGQNIIKVCRGTACYVRGGARILGEFEKQLGVKVGETTSDLKYSLEAIACFGSCALAPVVVVNDKVYGKMTTSRVKEILKAES